MRIDFTGSQNDTFIAEALNLPKYPLDEAVRWIQGNLEPEQVFTEDQLGMWAESNGFERTE